VPERKSAAALAAQLYTAYQAGKKSNKSPFGTEGYVLAKSVQDGEDASDADESGDDGAPE